MDNNNLEFLQKCYSIHTVTVYWLLVSSWINKERVTRNKKQAVKNVRMIDMILAIDYGTKRVGLAISDETMNFAYTQPAIIVKTSDQLLDTLCTKILDEHIDTIVMGLPLGNDDKPTQMSLKIKEFGEKLLERTKVKIVYWNEVMTSRLAQIYLPKNKRDGKLDSKSAQIMLQEYLDFNLEQKRQNYYEK